MSAHCTSVNKSGFFKQPVRDLLQPTALDNDTFSTPKIRTERMDYAALEDKSGFAVAGK